MCSSCMYEARETSRREQKLTVANAAGTIDVCDIGGALPRR